MKASQKQKVANNDGDKGMEKGKKCFYYSNYFIVACDVVGKKNLKHETKKEDICF